MTKLYSTMKFHRFQEQLEATRDGRVIAPVHIRLKPINRCNHDCWYCAYRWSELKLGEDMVEADAIPEAKMMEIVDDIVEMKVRAVTFSGGGEPLLYKPLPEAIDRLAAGGVRVASLTNGSNLKGRMAEAFARHGTWVRISVDGWDDDSYVKERNAKPGEFNRLLDNIRAFCASGTKCVLGISLIVGEGNHKHVAEACRLFKDCGVNHVKISGVVTSNQSGGCNAYHTPLKAEVARQIELASDLVDDRFHILNHYHDVPERFDKSYDRCPFLMFQTVIGADCQVYACHDKAYTVPGTLGSIKDRRFKDFWYSEDNRRAMHAIDPSVHCTHHCVANAQNLAILDYLSIDPEHGLFV